VLWNGASLTTTFVSATQLTAAVTATDIATAGSAKVTVTNPTPGGGTSAAASFAINNPAPVISSLSPASILEGSSSFTLTVNGSNFVVGSTVQWSGNNLTTTVVSSTQLTATVPASDIASAANVAVAVANPSPGGGASAAVNFAVNNPVPSITDLSPVSATAGTAAQKLTINGASFVPSSTVTYNDAAHTATFVSSTQLTISLSTIDQATAGTYPVVVTNPSPGGGASSAVNFTLTQPAVTGRVDSGQNPISGAQVYLLAAGTTGYGGSGIPASSTNQSSSLLTSGEGSDSIGYYVTTDSNGSFTITGDYTCPTASTQVYLYALGGNPGAGTNTAAGLMEALGPCGSLSSSTTIVINEVSTIATAYALAGFATDALHISSSGSALAATGVANAFATVTNLETLNTGLALATTPAGNGTVPANEINTLADILAACINSTGSGSTGCATLFNNALNGTTAPTDTAAAAINIAHNPGVNIANLYALATASAPFQPTLATQPNDFTIAINYTGFVLNNPVGIAIDGSGNILVASEGNSSVVEFNSLGVPYPNSPYSGGGLDFPINIAIDGSGNIWLGNFSGDSSGVWTVSEFNSLGVPYPNSPYAGGGFDYPGANSIAIDGSGNIWLGNQGGAAGGLNSISEFSSDGTANAASPFTGGGLSFPYGIAIDVSGNVWVANDGFRGSGNSISEYSPSNRTFSSPAATGYTGGGLNAPDGIAIDGSGNVWVANSDGLSNSISEFNSDGTPNAASPFTGGGLKVPSYLAIDGQGNVWALNSGADSISEFSPFGVALSGSSGYTGIAPGFGGDSLLFIAIDGSGNVWVAGNGVSESVGAAYPVVTPIVANLLAPYGSHAVNKP
jgi:hypothetical protein